jgi:hypothetical protein
MKISASAKAAWRISYETKKIEENEKDMAKIGAHGVGNHGGGAQALGGA